MHAKTERFEMRLDQSVLEKVDGWRANQDDMPSRAEAVRRLIESGFETSSNNMSFVLMRFQILTFALTDTGKRKISDSYLYAWDESVYPMSALHGGWHKPFKEHFEVTEEMMEELGRFLDDRWLAKEVPTFYELEDHFEVRGGMTEWSRAALIGACRYMFLHKLFDDKFWKTLITPREHPTEAASVVRKFNRDHDIYFL